MHALVASKRTTAPRCAGHRRPTSSIGWHTATHRTLVRLAFGHGRVRIVWTCRPASGPSAGSAAILWVVSNQLPNHRSSWISLQHMLIALISPFLAAPEWVRSGIRAHSRRLIETMSRTRSHQWPLCKGLPVDVSIDISSNKHIYGCIRQKLDMFHVNVVLFRTDAYF